MICSNCGVKTEIGFRDEGKPAFCPHCGGILRPEPSEGRLARKDPRVTVGLAAFLGVLIMGVGHFSVGRIGRGLFFLFAGLITLVLFFISYYGAFFGESFSLTILFGVVWVVLWILQVGDVLYLTRKYNEVLEATGRSPW